MDNESADMDEVLFLKNKFKKKKQTIISNARTVTFFLLIFILYLFKNIFSTSVIVLKEYYSISRLCKCSCRACICELVSRSVSKA